jgi:hypothetical protein
VLNPTQGLTLLFTLDDQNYHLITGIPASIAVQQATVTGITTVVSNINMTAYEAYVVEELRDLDDIKAFADLPDEVDVTTTGIAQKLPITWASTGREI